jgi:ribosomal protein S27E
MTRREWLKMNPAPDPQEKKKVQSAPGGPLVDQLVPKLGLCAHHPQAQVYRHMNRPDDLFACEQGPHYLFWTLVNGKPAFQPIAALALPGLDYAMLPGVQVSRAEWLSKYPPQPLKCPKCAVAVLQHNPMDRIDVFTCRDCGRFLWTLQGGQARYVPAEGIVLPAFDQPI